MVVVIPAIGLLHVGALREGHEWGGDFSLYIAHAKNLVEGVSYADTGYLYNPHYPAVGPPTYPPICPLILAPVYAAVGANLTVIKGAMIACFVLFLLMLVLCFRKELPPIHLLALVALIGTNHFFVFGANEIGSDGLFLVFLYLAIFLIQTAYGQIDSPRRKTATLLLAGVAIYLAFGTRTLGALLIPALLVQDFLQSKRITPAALLATGVFGCLAILQSMLFHSDHHYLDQFGAGPMVLLHNGVAYVGRMAAFWHNGYSKPLTLLVFAAVAALGGLGYFHSVRRKITVLEIFPAFYLAAIFVWPSYQGTRYLCPIFPLLGLYVFRGLAHPWIAGRVRLRRAAFASLLVVASGSYLARYTTVEFGPLDQGPLKRESTELFDYLAAQTDVQDVIVFVKPRVMSLFAGRRSSVYHEADNDAQLWDYFRQIGATHVVVVEKDETMGFAEDPALLEYLRRFVARNRQAFDPVFANADFTVFRIHAVSNGRCDHPGPRRA